ncbi:MAG: dicarboxylate/amino acid:cation symporter, partial [Rickettsiales bacterium]|nr:dicarboxylate/amino acid:cation symporter [Rickettsiales bacterium]
MGKSVMEWRLFGLSFWQWVLIGLILGITTGFVLGEQAAPLQIFGTIFIKLIKMVVAPLILLAIISGITSLTEAHHFRSIALKGTGAYFLTSFLAIATGLLLGVVFEPGVGVPIPEGAEVPAAVATPTSLPSAGDFFLSLIPSNIIHAMSEDMYLQIVIFAVFTGVVMNNIRGKTAQVKEIVHESAHVVFKMIEWIVLITPLAVFGLMASMVGTTGFGVLVSLLKLVALVIGACFFQYVFYGLLIAVFGRISPFPFYRKMITTQIMAFSTSSSKAVLTTVMRELQDKMGVSQSTSNFMMPLGACLNMDGTAIYLGIVAVFFSQMYGIP